MFCCGRHRRLLTSLNFRRIQRWGRLDLLFPPEILTSGALNYSHLKLDLEKHCSLYIDEQSRGLYVYNENLGNTNGVVCLVVPQLASPPSYRNHICPNIATSTPSASVFFQGSFSASAVHRRSRFHDDLFRQ